MTIRYEGSKLAMAAVALLAAGCAVETGTGSQEKTEQSAAALTSSTISNDVPDGITYSTGNVYFTTHHTGLIVYGGGAGAGAEPSTALRLPLITTSSVMRTSKYSVPGQEITLWSEQGSRFGDIVWALVGGNYYGYFLSQNLSTSVVTIKRVPLAGGTAVDIAGGIGTDIDIVNGHHLLDTDGTNLYWQDATSVYRMPIGGGAHTVLATTSPNTPTAGVYVTGGNVYFASPTSVESVPTSGGAVHTWFNAPDRVVTISAAPYGTNTMVAWGLYDGSAEFLLTGVTLGIKQPDGFMPTSLAPALAESFGYIACTSASCELNGTGQTISSGAFGLDVDLSQPSTYTAFWGDSTGVHRFASLLIL
ncbi:MAG TPA: hypothetical protein VMI75_02030 [Polyangiaceae bacterium]|nr:hypothetical protein [Polyangiaceae bacterium]